MYAHVENGTVDYRGKLPKNWKNISGLNLSEGDNTFLKTIGWLPLTETKVTPAYNEVLDSDQVVINADDVQITQRVRGMTSDERAVRDTDNMVYLREIRNSKLAATDFYALSDVTMSSDMATYRQALRDLPATADITKWDTADWAWPTEPA
jgi:hypothetical protein